MHLNKLFLGIGFVAGISLACPVMAVPSVKRFGNTTNNISGKKTNTQSVAGKTLSSGRVSGLTGKNTGSTPPPVTSPPHIKV